MHHALLEPAQFGEFGFEGGDFVVDLSEDGETGTMNVRFWPKSAVQQLRSRVGWESIRVIGRLGSRQ